MLNSGKCNAKAEIKAMEYQGFVASKNAGGTDNDETAKSFGFARRKTKL